MKRTTALATAASVSMVLLAGGVAAQAVGVFVPASRKVDTRPVATVGTPPETSAATTATPPTETPATEAPSTPARTAVAPVAVTRQAYDDTHVTVGSGAPAGDAEAGDATAAKPDDQTSAAAQPDARSPTHLSAAPASVAPIADPVPPTEVPKARIRAPGPRTIAPPEVDGPRDHRFDTGADG